MEPAIVQKGPFAVEVAEGETYYWCRCGRSSNQPFCDRAHEGTPFTPVAFTPAVSGTVHLRGGKRTSKAPFCEGVHETP